MSQPEPPEDAQISQPDELPLEVNDAPPKAEAHPASDPEPTSEPATESKSDSSEPAKESQLAEPAKDEKPETSKKDTKEVNREKEEAPRDKPKPAEDSNSDESGNKPKSKDSESGDQEDGGEKENAAGGAPVLATAEEDATTTRTILITIPKTKMAMPTGRMARAKTASPAKPASNATLNARKRSAPKRRQRLRLLSQSTPRGS